MTPDPERPSPVAAEVTRPRPKPKSGARGHLPRLQPESYRGFAVVFWTHTIAHRVTGWLDHARHGAFREQLLHAAIREQLLCPIYTMMPDHIHFVWMGLSRTSDQRNASSFLRAAFKSALHPCTWQHQPHDHVMRDDERKQGAFAAICAYIAENPVRRRLADRAADWPFTGCVVPGYPALDPRAEGFWDLFWRIHAACVERGQAGKM